MVVQDFEMANIKKKACKRKGRRAEILKKLSIRKKNKFREPVALKKPKKKKLAKEDQKKKK